MAHESARKTATKIDVVFELHEAADVTVIIKSTFVDKTFKTLI